MCGICWPTSDPGMSTTATTTNVLRSVSSLASTTFLAQQHYWTWREAIEVATRANAVDRPTVTRDGDRWLVRYRVRPVLMNAG